MRRTSTIPKTPQEKSPTRPDRSLSAENIRAADRVSQPTSRTADVEIVKTIISLGKGLGLDVIAEGVETESQAAQLRQYGCDFAQGHLYSPGIKREDLEQSLATGLKPAAATASSQGARTGDEGRAGAVNGL